MLADTAIAVNPDDERYTRLIGETAILPLVGRRLPIIADEYVDPEFGTGALKITPGPRPERLRDRPRARPRGGHRDRRGRPHDRAAAGERFAGLHGGRGARRRRRRAARRRGSISGTQPYVHDVPHSHRSGQRIEPLISLQWFCDMDELAEPAIDAPRRTARCASTPSARTRGVYLDWLENIRPWCISRQLWWGHQLPVWYRGEETYVGDASRREGDGWERDPDVLDTWFSSALWPFATLGWPEETPELRAFYPTDVLSTARDIIFLWVARMVMMGIEFTGELPFTRRADPLGDPGARRPPDVEVARHRHRPARRDRDARRRRAALRPARDVVVAGRALLSEERVKQGADLANKLWNASRLVLLRVEDVRAGAAAARRSRTAGSCRGSSASPSASTELLRRLPTSRTPRSSSTTAFWGELCDWYLELVKPRLYDEAATAAAVGDAAVRARAHRCALLHPIMPFVTEEIWSLPARASAGCWPSRPGRRRDASSLDEEAEAVVGPRRSRPSPRCAATATRSGRRPRRRSRRGSRRTGYEDTGEQVARLARFEFVADGDDGDAGGDRRRARRRRPGARPRRRSTRRRRRGAARRGASELEAEIARAEGKLANEGFVERAPAEVVEARARQARAATGASSTSWLTMNARARPRSTCSTSSCSACGSGSTACTS